MYRNVSLVYGLSNNAKSVKERAKGKQSSCYLLSQFQEATEELVEWTSRTIGIPRSWAKKKSGCVAEDAIIHVCIFDKRAGVMPLTVKNQRDSEESGRKHDIAEQGHDDYIISSSSTHVLRFWGRTSLR